MLLMSASISKAGGVQALNYMLYVKDKFSMNVVETFRSHRSITALLMAELRMNI